MKIALVGIGEIARAQHIPALAESPDWQLAATVSRTTSVAGVENFSTIEELIDARNDIPVVSLCMPPGPRFDIAQAAIDAGLHVMLEKPPGTTVSECVILHHRAVQAGVSLYATWHSREAAMLDQCQIWLAGKTVTSFEINWKEDVRRWHPGQEWIWHPGGMGVFDPGINALSILTKILPESVRILTAELETPANKYTPIAATLQMVCGNGAAGVASFDWRQSGEQIWDITINTDSGPLHIKEGGARVVINGEQQSPPRSSNALAGEYPRLYQHMFQLVSDRASECDLRPLELVADAFMLAKHKKSEAFTS